MTNNNQEWKTIMQAWRKQHPNKVLICPYCSKLIQYIHRKKEGQWKCQQCQQTFKTPKTRNRIRTNTKRRKLRDDMIISHNIAKQIINDKVPDPYEPQYKLKLKKIAFVSTLYITARRESEIIGIKDSEYIQYQRIIKKNPDKKSELKKPKKWIVKPLMRKQIIEEIINDQAALVFENIPVLKRKFEDIKTNEGIIKNYPLVSFALVPQYDKEFIKHLKKWLDIMDKKYDYQETGKDYEIFPISNASAWRYVDYVFDKKVYPHWLRHSRLTNLAKDARFTGLMLMQFVGWSSPIMASQYTHLDTGTLFGAMLNGLTSTGMLKK